MECATASADKPISHRASILLPLGLNWAKEDVCRALEGEGRREGKEEGKGERGVEGKGRDRKGSQ
jgi:hypothetical protein